MKDILRFIAAGLIIYFGVKYLAPNISWKSDSKGAPSGSFFGESRESSGVSDELGNIMEEIFSPLVDKDQNYVRGPDPTIKLSKILGKYEMYAQKGVKTELSRSVVKLSQNLQAAYRERKKFEEGLEALLREVWVASNRGMAMNKRQAFINGDLSRWQRYCDDTKPGLLRALATIQRLEL